MVRDVEARVSKYWFLNTKNSRKEIRNIKEIKKLGAHIISKCQNILTLTDDPYCKEQLNLIIRNTTNLMTLTSETSTKNPTENDDKIIEACRELQTNILSIPATIHTPTDLATASYRLAQACLYILVLSAALAIGATFGAWYFGFLTATYFTDTLAVALASIGIPGVCLGLFSYGVYSVQKNPVEAQLNDLVENIDLFCKEIVQFDEEYEMPQSPQL